MDPKIATRTNHRAFDRRQPVSSNIVCRFWLAGKCNRNPCKFLHRDLAPPASNVYFRTPKQSDASLKEQPRKRTFNNQFTQKISKHSDHTDAPKQCTERKNFSVPAPEVYALEDKRSQKPMKALSYPTIEDVLREHPETIASVDSTIECRTRDDVEMSVVSTAESDGPKDKETVLISTSRGDKAVEEGTKRVCLDWMFGNCDRGDECTFLHKWYSGDWFSMLKKLGEHKQAASGIALPPDCDKLFTSSRDGNVNVWDCHTGDTTSVISLGDEIGSLISEGPWVFVSLPNVIKAWNLETRTELSLDGHCQCGQIYDMAVAGETLFAGAQDGSILVWRGSNENSMPFQVATSLNGHTGAVICLIVGSEEKKLYSGSMDGTIRAWDVDTLQCIHVLAGHTDAVTSVICWDNYLLSCSMDRTIKVWGYTADSKLEVIYTHYLEHGAVTLCGLSDSEGKPVLCCSCNDNTVYMFELPSFNERGRIFSKQQVKTIQTGSGGLLFTGDGGGLVTVWKVAAS